MPRLSGNLMTRTAALANGDHAQSDITQNPNYGLGRDPGVSAPSCAVARIADRRNPQMRTAVAPASLFLLRALPASL